MRDKRRVSVGPKVSTKRRDRPATTAMPGAELILDREADTTIHFFKAEGDVIISHTQHGILVNRPVSFDSLADIFSGGGFASGLLPPNIIATGRRNGTPFFVLYAPPQQKVKMHIAGDRLHTFTIPTPPLVIAGYGTDYRIFALARKQKPTQEHTLLALPPLPNTYENGGICWGSAWSEAGEKLPTVSPTNLQRALKRLLSESVFTHSGTGSRSKSYPDNIYGLWAKLERERVTTYPIEDLRASKYSLRDLTSGTIWEKRS